MQVIKSIQNRIYEIRGERVMLDFDLAELYEVATKALNQAVKRNKKRFPEDFMFRLTSIEWMTMWSQFVTTSENVNSMSPQIVTSSQNNRRTDNTPYAFTEQGVAMLSSVLHSDKAIQMNISIMRAFVETRRLVFQEFDLKRQLQEIREVLGVHDNQLNQIYEAIENLLDENAVQRKWNDRERIGFKK
ncbi:MAG: ORF6N domain-containing protein [Bacillota bacterium]|nr:ORF6N domain-containing protein [Bacillota bacterium]